jgi:hypothetical protein
VSVLPQKIPEAQSSAKSWKNRHGGSTHRKIAFATICDSNYLRSWFQHHCDSKELKHSAIKSAMGQKEKKRERETQRKKKKGNNLTNNPTNSPEQPRSKISAAMNTT